MNATETHMKVGNTPPTCHHSETLYTRRARPYIVTILAPTPSEGRPGLACLICKGFKTSLGHLPVARKRATHEGNQHVTIVNRVYVQEAQII